MNNKLSELSKPVAWTWHAYGLQHATTEEDERDELIADGVENSPLYSQEYVSVLQHESAVNWEAAASLNVENQELKKRIAELEDDKRQLNEIINSEANRADAAEKRLATPVRLPPADSQGRYHGMMTRFAIKKAGFTVEGDE
ncbi:hypothetical protein MX027_08215 [Serratia marcescens]|uniref:hypothetical protein n=1 Tax=Serratia marcescens TaxID=615 RepID=UPI001FF14F91|nr:hypothetical protein [Serratia marcescens]MCK1087193.1 hypothetical protein [Serratia marcescens]